MLKIITVRGMRNDRLLFSKFTAIRHVLATGCSKQLQDLYKTGPRDIFLLNLRLVLQKYFCPRFLALAFTVYCFTLSFSFSIFWGKVFFCRFSDHHEESRRKRMWWGGTGE